MSSENPYKKYEPLFEKWPWVEAQDVCGEHGMKVSGWHLTPDGDKAANMRAFFVSVLWFVLIGFCFHAGYYKIRHHAGLWAVAAFAVWLVLAHYSRFALQYRAAKGTAVYFSLSYIKIGQKVYDAKVQHKFSMDIHREAKKEADAELRAQQRGPGYADVRHTRYYRDSHHIFFEYLGQRILVADILGEEMAEKFLRALVAVDRIIHNENTVFAANANTETPEETRQADYFGQRPPLD